MLATLGDAVERLDPTDDAGDRGAGAAAAGLRRGQGGALVRHRGADPGRAARPAHAGAAQPVRVRGDDHAGRWTRRWPRCAGRCARPAWRRNRLRSILLAGGSSRIPLVSAAARRRSSAGRWCSTRARSTRSRSAPRGWPARARRPRRAGTPPPGRPARPPPSRSRGSGGRGAAAATAAGGPTTVAGGRTPRSTPARPAGPRRARRTPGPRRTPRVPGTPGPDQSRTPPPTWAAGQRADGRRHGGPAGVAVRTRRRGDAGGGHGGLGGWSGCRRSGRRQGRSASRARVPGEPPRAAHRRIHGGPAHRRRRRRGAGRRRAGQRPRTGAAAGRARTAPRRPRRPPRRTRCRPTTC